MDRPFRILTCQGIGDSVWTMLKAQSIARAHGHDTVEVLIGGWDRTDVECRALPLLRRFTFVSGARFYEMPKTCTGGGPMLVRGQPTDRKGRYRYLPDGAPPFWLEGDVDFVAVPNRALENGTRLEDWLPEYDTDWKAVSRAVPWNRPVDDRLPHLTRYVVFYMGAEGANSWGNGGHNRGGLWKPEEWAALGDRIVDDLRCNIVVVGAGYDASYYRTCVQHLVKQPEKWVNFIGEWPLMETLSMLRDARAVVSYQSGIGIVAHYLNIPTAMWWRPEGDSIVEGANVTFSEDMAHCWCRPDWRETNKHLPCIYGRESVEDILNWLKTRL